MGTARRGTGRGLTVDIVVVGILILNQLSGVLVGRAKQVDRAADTQRVETGKSWSGWFGTHWHVSSV